MARTEQTDRICIDCWERAVDAFGTGELFQKRSRRYTTRIQWLSFSGLVLPLFIGGVVIGFGPKTAYLERLLIAAAILGIPQLVMSLWALVASWADNLQYSLESAAENADLAARFQELAQQAQHPPDNLELKAVDDARRKADSKRSVSAQELRYAHRAGLRRFQRECVECHLTPHSMEPTKCNTCGGF
jgi:mobilome CxxCx(11)CxxC protein